MTPALRILASAALAAMALLAAGCNSDSAQSSPGGGAVVAGDPWSNAQVVEPAALAAQLASAQGGKPLLLHVGFRVLYRAGAIPGSRYIGPGSEDAGLAALEAAVKDEPRDREIVLYCGCCPWDHCPNMRPAFKALADRGFTNVRALYVPHNLDTDWAGKGYPIEKPVD